MYQISNIWISSNANCKKVHNTCELFSFMTLLMVRILNEYMAFFHHSIHKIFENWHAVALRRFRLGYTTTRENHPLQSWTVILVILVCLLFRCIHTYVYVVGIQESWEYYVYLKGLYGNVTKLEHICWNNWSKIQILEILNANNQ